MAIVTRDHHASHPDPIRFGAGAILRWERRASEWEGWLWCTDAEGVTGWVPENCVERLDEQACRSLREYDATELSVKTGDTLAVKFSESGWAWCAATDGRTGWVPESHIASS